MCRDANTRIKDPKSAFTWFYLLQIPQQWLHDTHLDAGIHLLRGRYAQHPEWFRTNRICFVDTNLTLMWVKKYPEFVKNSALPAGAFDYFMGTEPSYCQSNKQWGLEVDDIYVPLNVSENHWVALWISIPDRRITIWDSLVSHTSAVAMQKVVEPIAVIMAYILHELAPRADRYKYPETPFTQERWPASKVPQNQITGDCGVFCLKYIECHALGVPFSPGLCDENVKLIRDKLAADIFDETTIRGTEYNGYKGLDLYDQK